MSDILWVGMHHRFDDQAAFLQACADLGWTRIIEGAVPPDNIEVVTPWNVALDPIGEIQDQEPGYYVAAEWSGTLPESFTMTSVYLPEAPGVSPHLSKQRVIEPAAAPPPSEMQIAPEPQIIEQSEPEQPEPDHERQKDVEH
jgi:hypothetical protein